MKKLKLSKLGKVVAYSLFFIALILLGSENDNFTAFVLGKLIGITLMYLDYKLLKKANIME